MDNNQIADRKLCKKMRNLCCCIILSNGSAQNYLSKQTAKENEIFNMVIQSLPKP